MAELVARLPHRENKPVFSSVFCLDRRAKQSVAQFTGSEEYSFGDISKELEKRRAAWVEDYIGKGDYQ